MYPACGTAGLIKLLLARVSPVFSRSVSTSYRAVGSCHQAPPALATAVVFLFVPTEVIQRRGVGWEREGGKEEGGGEGVNET